MPFDSELLKTFGASGSSDAFAEIARRHGNLVFSVCRRILGQGAAAEDAAQATFLLLLEKAPRLPPDTLLAGWLYRSAENIARNHRKTRERRVHHEKEAAKMSRVENPPADEWEAVRPCLDEILASLPDPQKDAIVRRFIEGRTEVEIAVETGCPRTTVAWRIQAGIDRIREGLRRRGIPISLIALVALLEARAVEPAPEGFFDRLGELLRRPRAGTGSGRVSHGGRAAGARRAFLAAAAAAGLFCLVLAAREKTGGGGRGAGPAAGTEGVAAVASVLSADLFPAGKDPVLPDGGGDESVFPSAGSPRGARVDPAVGGAPELAVPEKTARYGPIAFRREEEIWAVEMDGTGLRRLLSARPHRYLTGGPSWNRDGSLLAFQGGEIDFTDPSGTGWGEYKAKVWVLNREGREEEVFSGSAGGRYGLSVVGITTENEFLVVTGPRRNPKDAAGEIDLPSKAEAEAEKRKVLEKDAAGEIHLLSKAGTGSKKLLEIPEERGAWVGISVPEGNRIALLEYPLGFLGRPRLRLVDVRGGEAVEPFEVDGVPEGGCTVAPDGSAAVFRVRKSSGHWSLHLWEAGAPKVSVVAKGAESRVGAPRCGASSFLDMERRRLLYVGGPSETGRADPSAAILECDLGTGQIGTVAELRASRFVAGAAFTSDGRYAIMTVTADRKEYDALTVLRNGTDLRRHYPLRSEIHVVDLENGRQKKVADGWFPTVPSANPAALPPPSGAPGGPSGSPGGPFD